MKGRKKEKNFAYKAIVTAFGLILLFKKFTPFETEDVRVNYFQGDVFVELGDNVFLLTDTIIAQLFKYPKIFMSIGDTENYEMLNLPYEIDVDSNVLAQIKGAISVMKTQEMREEIRS